MRGGHGTRIKLCGMFRAQDIDIVNEIRPDFVGFVVNFDRSHRSVSAEELVGLSRRVEPDVRKVGVFVDEPHETVARLYELGAIDIAQLHGHEDEDYLRRLRGACPVPVIQAFTARSASDVAHAEASSASLVLLDNGKGSGRSFDWSLLKGVRRPFMLAGGLGPDNVADAICAVRPWAVDMSSGLETGGLKDPRKMREAVCAVRNIIWGETPFDKNWQKGVSPQMTSKKGER